MQTYYLDTKASRKLVERKTLNHINFFEMELVDWLEKLRIVEELAVGKAGNEKIAQSETEMEESQMREILRIETRQWKEAHILNEKYKKKLKTRKRKINSLKLKIETAKINILKKERKKYLLTRRCSNFVNRPAPLTKAPTPITVGPFDYSPEKLQFVEMKPEAFHRPTKSTKIMGLKRSQQIQF